MHRLIVLFYWIFKEKNNVSFIEIIRLVFFRSSANKRAKNYINQLEKVENFYKITFKRYPYVLFWPVESSTDNINMVICETFDSEDWHFYQKQHTEIVAGDTLLDIGAAEGLFSLSVVDKCKKVILIEPNDFFIKALQKSFIKYSEKVQIINAAVGSAEGTIIFDNNSINSRITESKEGVKVRIAKIDSLGIESITYLKADIEGHEYEMLLGAAFVIKRDKPKIAITTYHVGNNAQQIIQLILSYVPEYNYYCKGIGQWGGRPVMIHFWID